MDGLNYEYAVAKYLKKHGYYSVSVTKGSGDYGVDVIASKGSHKYAVQCKFYSNPVGLGAVQEVVAGKAMYGCDCAMVVTNSTFTKAARELAQKNDVALLENVTGHSLASTWSIIRIAITFFVLYAFFELFSYNVDFTVVIACRLVLLLGLLISLTALFYKAIYAIATPKKVCGKLITFFAAIGIMSVVITSYSDLIDQIKTTTVVVWTRGISAVILFLWIVVLICRMVKKTQQKQQPALSTNHELEVYEGKNNEVTINEQSTSIFSESFNDKESSVGENTEVALANSQDKSMLPETPQSIMDILKTRYENECAEWKKEHTRLLDEMNVEFNRILSILEDSFATFGVEISLQDSKIEGTDYLFYIKPKAGVRIKTIQNSLIDVALHMGTEAILCSPLTKESVILLTIPSGVALPENPPPIMAAFEDELLPDVVEIILDTKQVSVSMLQRRLKLGSAHAARIVDELESLGIVGPFEGSKPRQLLITQEQWDSMVDINPRATPQRKSKPPAKPEA